MLKTLLSAPLLVLLSVATGCSAGGAGASSRASGNGPGTGGSSSLSVGGSTGASTSLNLGGDAAMDVDGGDGSNPATCDEAGKIGSYVGCDFWPTIVANPVWNEFQPAVVVANGSMMDAQLTIDGPASFHQQVTVAAGGLQTVMLAWVPDLKGPEFSLANTSGGRMTYSVRENAGAYHMTSTAPVTAWQFNPLNYEDTTPAGCPSGLGSCLSASVDASLLLPSTAMTKNYRIFGYAETNEGSDWGSVPGGAAITATQDNTTVTVQLGPKCGKELWPSMALGTCVSASDPMIGAAVDAKNAGDIYTFAMNAGDVVELVGAWSDAPQTRNADISGSVINATAPVQVVSFNAIAQMPDATVGNADHMEETVLPAEVIGKKYVVVPPTAPGGGSIGHVVRIYGNVDGKHLTYTGTPPAGAPALINAGDMVQIPPLPTGQPPASCTSSPEHCMISAPFIVEGDQPFAVESFMVGGALQMPSGGVDASGDPSMTTEVTPQQFRKQYTFLAPSNYLENWADVLVPTGANVTLDGNPLTGTPTAIDADWGYVRAKLDNSGTGVHNISTTNASGLGLQVIGFGHATSYYYPGGLNLIHISDAPMIVVK